MSIKVTKYHRTLIKVLEDLVHRWVIILSAAGSGWNVDISDGYRISLAWYYYSKFFSVWIVGKNCSFDVKIDCFMYEECKPSSFISTSVFSNKVVSRGGWSFYLIGKFCFLNCSYFDFVFI